MNKRQCAFLSDNGQRCGAPPLRDGRHCLFHDPAHEQDATEARRLGGLRRRRELAIVGAYEFAGFHSLDDLRRLLEIATYDTLTLENGVARNRALASFVDIAVKIFAAADLQQRIEQVEHSVRGLEHEDSEDVFDVEATELSWEWVDAPDPEPDATTSHEPEDEQE